MGRGLRRINCKGKPGGVNRRKKPMRIIKCCMINEHFLESLSVCLELTLQQVSWLFCRMKTDSIVLSSSLADTCQHTLSPSPQSLLSELNSLVNFHSFPLFFFHSVSHCAGMFAESTGSPTGFSRFEIDNSFMPVNKLLNVRPQMEFSWWGLGSKALLEKQEG